MNGTLNEEHFDETLLITGNKKLRASVSVLMVLLATFTVLANGTIAVAMIRTLVRETRRGVQSKPGNSIVTRIVVMSLAFSGVLVGGFIMPLSVHDFINNGKMNLEYKLCLTCVYIDYLQSFTTNLHSMFIAVDTYLLVRHPLVHHFLTAKTGYALVTIAWILPAILVTVWGILQKDKLDECYPVVHSFYDFDISTIFSFIFGAIFVVLVVAVWLLYFIILKEISKFIKRPSRSVFNIDTSSNRSALSVTPLAPEIKKGNAINGHPRRTLKSNAKSFRYIGLILLSLAIGWLPIWILYFTYHITGLVLPLWLYKTFAWVQFVSYAVNPLLYCSNKQIRRSVKVLICTFKPS